MKNRVAFSGIEALLAATEKLWPDIPPITVIWTLNDEKKLPWQKRWKSSVMGKHDSWLILLDAKQNIAEATGQTQFQLINIITSHVHKNPSEVMKLPHAPASVKDNVLQHRVYLALHREYEDRMSQRSHQLAAEGLPIAPMEGV